MEDATPKQDPQKKYWWAILIALPIILALIALIPDFLNSKESERAETTTIPESKQKSDQTEQSTSKGSNFNNVQGNITIIESNDTDK